MISAFVLKAPRKLEDRVEKGAIILSNSDELCKIIPQTRDYFYIVERRGWEGINNQETADIKLVEDLSTWDKVKELYPNALLLDVGPADFVDTSKFKPLHCKKHYTAIQIARWDRFKRHGLFVRAASLLKGYNFLLLGHFADGGTKSEIGLLKETVELSENLMANISFPYADHKSNRKLPNSPEEINKIINRSKMGILTTKVEGINRFKMECLSANIPVLVPSDTSFPTKKHINPKTGYIFDPTPEGLAKGIEYVDRNYGSFRPREYVLSNTGHQKSLEKLSKALNSLASRDKSTQRFNNIYWDGRNQNLVWERNAVSLIKKYITGKESY